MRQNLKTLSGNRVEIEFDGIRVGLVRSVRSINNYGLEDASGIGDIHVIEHVPGKAVHSVNVNGMTMFEGNLRSAGLIAENGDAMLQGEMFDLVFYRKDTNTVQRKITGLTLDNDELDVTAHQIVMQTATFRALDAAGKGM